MTLWLCIAGLVLAVAALAPAASEGSCPSGSAAGTCRAEGGPKREHVQPKPAGVALLQKAVVHTGASPSTDTLMPMNANPPKEPQQPAEKADEVVGAPSVEMVADYDCNGDGVNECGVWDYQMSMCANQMYCGHLYKFPDITLDQSCRCRKCHSPDFAGTAFGDSVLLNPAAGAPFEAMSWGTFQTWANHMDTCAPWVMPKDDVALQNLLAYARHRGYKVRISGAGHSAGGIVTDGQNNQVLVLSLAEYVAPPGEWEFGVRDMPDGSKRATVNAGWTQAHLYQKVRPLGFFLPAQTAGYFFQLGGIVANSVHGGAYNAGFVHSYATRLRVMTYDGNIRIVDTEEEMRYWRCSFGLLGIILGIEFQLEQREQLQMYSVEKKMESWNAEEFWKFIKQHSEADVPSDIVPEGGAGSRKSWNGEYFIDFINGGETPSVAVYAQKANSSVDADFNGELRIPSKIHEEYEKLMGRTVNDGEHGLMSWGEAARRDGSPPIMIASVDVNDFLRSMRRLPLARTMSRQAIVQIPNLASALNKKYNDGFFLTHSPAALAAAYFVHPSKGFEAMDFLRRVQLDSINDKDFMWNLPGEFRFINVQDSAVLQPVEPGLWFNAQMISFADLAKNDQAWKKDFKVVEDYWVNELGAKPHMGKLMGFREKETGEVQPFADEYVCTIYSNEQKEAFSSYREQMDPDGLFATGLGMKFLAPCA